MIKLSVPLRVDISSKSKWTLNLNSYRNAHYHVLNKSKQVYTDICLALLKEANVPVMDKIFTEYVWFPQTRRKADVLNVCSIVDKYFSDALVEGGYIPDDNYDHILGYTHSFGSVDPKNPRVEITIHIIQGKDMQFQLNQDTIAQLVQEHVENLITLKEGTELQVSFDADGTATVNIGLAKKTVATKTAKPEPTKAKEAPVKKEEETKEELVEPELPNEDEVPLQTEGPVKEEDKKEEPKQPTKGGLFANLARPS